MKEKISNDKELLELIAEAESSKIKDLKDTNTRLLKQIDKLKDKKADPSSNNNYPLLRASTNGCNEIIEVLWNDKRIKKNKYIKDILKNDNIDLYEKLITKDIKFKASNF